MELRAIGLHGHCNGCHRRAGEDDSMMFMPDDYGVSPK